jgi:glycosyltransferase involved in cell wall biosynthesis
MPRLVLYGAGKRCKRIVEVFDGEDIGEVTIVDSNPEICTKSLGKFCIKSIDSLVAYEKFDLCITIADDYQCKMVRTELFKRYGYNIQREIEYNDLKWELIGKIVKKKVSTIMKNKMDEQSILFDCTVGLGLGGIESWTKSLCINLLKKYNNIYIISDSKEYDVEEVLNTHILKSIVGSKDASQVRVILDLIDIIVGKLPCQVITCQPNDVLIASYFVKCVSPELVKVISVIHGGSKEIYENYIERRKCTDIYIGVSKDIKQDLIEYGIAEKDVLFMTCPFQCDKEINRTYSEDFKDAIRIGYAGRMDGMEKSQKRMDLMLKLIEELVDRKIKFTFELAGDGLARMEMEKFVSKKGYDNYVKFIGQIDRTGIPQFWERQDILVNCSDYEGHSIMQLEGMANGAVPIVTDVSGVREDITYDVNGYYVPIGDYMQMADKIEYLYLHRERLAEMGKAAHDSVYPKSSMEKHIKFWENILMLED